MARICILMTTRPWGEQRHFHKQAPALAQDGHEVILMADDPGRKVTDLFRMFALSARQRKLARPCGALNLLGTVLRLRPDVLQVCCLEQLPLGLVLKSCSRIKVIYDSREDMYHSMRDDKRWPRWVRWIAAQTTRVVEGLAARMFDGIVASDKAIYRLHRGMPAERKTVFYNTALLSMCPRDYPPLVERPYDLTWLRGSRERPQSYRLVGDALRMLVDRGDKFRVLLVGDTAPHERAVLDCAVEGVGDSQIITDIGRVPYEQVSAVLRQVKIGLVILPDMPKLRHNIACKAFDYMINGLPVICSDLPPQRLFIKEGESGFFYKHDDATGLADAISCLLNDTRRAQAMSDAGRRAIEEYWNNERDQEELRHFYRKIIAGPRRGWRGAAGK